MSTAVKKDNSHVRRRQPILSTMPVDYGQEEDQVADTHQSPNDRSEIEQTLDSNIASRIVVGTLTALAFILRLFQINHPDQVVFDEVHFGKFAAHYIQRNYYFDVHPPFAKMLFGLAGWFVGFDGVFHFDSIGDSYTENHVPFVGMRALAAIFGSLTVPVVYAIMKESGYSTLVAAFSASLILFDNAHITQSRLILLDAPLIFFLSLTMYAYVRFRKLRYHPFTTEWCGWLLATGVFMACTWGSKVNGILAVFAIGLAVLVDLWDVLDYKKNSMETFKKHFVYRAIGLILIPFIIYLSFFWVHLAILNHSGTGDTFMSPAFQETLVGNEMLLNSQEIRYYDTVNIKHRDTKVFLHSHPEKYPLKYTDGRISSQGQQVTGYAHNDTNNYWQIIPTKALPENGRSRIVRHEDLIQLLHVNTQTLLLTHDVASPLMPTNQEFTTVSKDKPEKYNDTLFYMNMADAHDGQPWKTKSGYFRLIHASTRVSLWTHKKQLPEWAFKQQEVNGNKNPSEKSAIWYVDSIVAGMNDDEFKKRSEQEPRKPKSMFFLRKWAELQVLMLQHNAGLTASHPYASGPLNWPFVLTGISFWTNGADKKQIYLVGNLVGWWICVVALSIYIGILGADLVARRRNMNPLEDPIRNRLWNNGGFFFLVWAVHYLPFFVMNRQLFIHHYLPSHLASSLIAGVVLSFILSDRVNFPISRRGPTTRLQPNTYADLGLKGVVVVSIILVFLLGMFVFLAPLTYGTPGLTGEQVNAKRLLSSWTLHFAAKTKNEVVV